MSKVRFSKGVTAQTTSFEALRPLFGLKPLERNKDKQKKDQKKFLSNPRYKCKACGEPMTFSGGNLMCCTNPKCKGIKVERTDDEGNTIVYYTPSFFLLNDKNERYANYIFNE